MKKGLPLLGGLLLLLIVFNIVVFSNSFEGGVDVIKDLEEVSEVSGEEIIEEVIPDEVEELVVEWIEEIEGSVGVGVGLNQILEREIFDEPEEIIEELEEEPVRILTIASWNIELFGDRELENDSLMDVYEDHIGDYDIIFIGGIRADDEGALQDLCGGFQGYDCRESGEVGRSSNKQLYGVVYRDDIEIDGWKEFSPDEDDRWEFPPIEVDFKVDDYSLRVYYLNTKPGSVREEIEYLEDVVDESGNVIVLGDLNADCVFYDPDEENDFVNWEWVIKDVQDTSSDSNDCAYDRIILNDDAYDEFEDSGVEDKDITKDVADNYLVWVELEF